MKMQNYVKNNKGNSLRDYIIKIDSKINIDSYTNDQLKSYIEDNYNISFNKRNKAGKEYINYNTFRKIAGEVRTTKKIYTEIQRMFLNKKDQARAKTYENVKLILSDLEIAPGMDYLLEVEAVEELCSKENCSKMDLDESIGFNIEKIIESPLFNKNKIKEYRSEISKLLKNDRLSKAYDLNQKMLKKIEADETMGKGLLYLNNGLTLEKYVKSCKIIDPSMDIKLVSVDLGNLGNVDLNQASEKNKKVIYNDGKEMMVCVYDSEGNAAAKKVEINDENIRKHVVNTSSPSIAGQVFNHSTNAVLKALKENLKLAVQGNPNNSFEDLLEKHEIRI